MSDRRLLILDDDPAVGQTIAAIAESIGMEIRFTSRHAEFFAIGETWRPSHIALDLVMPEMDGVQVLGELARRACRAQLIITSGSGSRVLAAAERSAVEHGLNIVGVLKKPFSPKELRQLLEKDITHRPAAGALITASRGRETETFACSEAELTRALEGRELRPYFQPKVDCATLVVNGFEALARWEHPVHGVLSADQFVPFAETHGMIGALTDVIFDQALRWFSGWVKVTRTATLRGENTQGMERSSLSLNVSARSIADAHFFDRLVARCEATHVEPADVMLELTETSAMDDPTASLDVMTRLRMKGFQLSIDDFGTGYSSMLQLVRLPFSEIKVDRSFVMTALQSSESRSVIKSIVNLGHSLGLKATAEGVEQAEVLHYLRRIGCDSAQGYLIGRPMPQAAIPDWIATRPQSYDSRPSPGM